MAIGDSDGSCSDYSKCRKEFLTRRSTEVLKALGGKDDARAMRDIIATGATLFKEYKELLPALTEIFNGNSSANFLTLLISAGAGKCDGIGRGKYDCSSNEYAFGDSGFHTDFQDNGNNQLFHVWPYIASVGGEFSFGGVGLSIVMFGNYFHERIQKGEGSSWNDYFMSQAGMEIGVAIANGDVQPNELADFVYQRLNSQGPGSFGMVDFYTKKYGPLYVSPMSP